MILPSIMPDELARSYLGRICRLNGIMSPATLRPQIEQAVASVSEDPEGCYWVELLAAVTQKTTQEFIAQHTVLSFRRAVRPEFDCLNHGNRRDSRERFCHVYPLGLTESIHHLCPACATEDLAFWGTSYWRRSHQLKAVARCEKHGLGLHHLKTAKWISLPHDVVAQSIPFDASIVDDAAQNPVIARYAEICSALAERDCPVSTNQMVQTIRHQFEKVNAKRDASGSRLSTLVIDRIRGPWQRHFFEDLTGSNSVPNTESLERTQSCVRLAYATHFYALVLAALFESAEQAIVEVSRPTVATVLRKMQSTDRQQSAVSLDDPLQNTPLTAAARAFFSGTSIADACRIHGGNPRQLEALLRVAAEPLRLVLE